MRWNKIKHCNDVPVAFTTTVLLDLLGVNINVAALGEEARQVFCWRDTAIGNALVVTVVVLVRTSHCYKTTGLAC